MVKNIITVLAVIAALTFVGCNKKHKSETDSYNSGWPLAAMSTGPYEVYIHRSWTQAEILCLKDAVDEHWGGWQSILGSLTIGNFKQGRIYVHGRSIRRLNDPYSRVGVLHYTTGNTPGEQIHVIADGNHQLKGLSLMIDQHQDPAFLGFDPWFTNQNRWSVVRLVDQFNVQGAKILQKLHNCSH